MGEYEKGRRGESVVERERRDGVGEVKAKVVSRQKTSESTKSQNRGEERKRTTQSAPLVLVLAQPPARIAKEAINLRPAGPDPMMTSLLCFDGLSAAAPPLISMGAMAEGVRSRVQEMSEDGRSGGKETLARSRWRKGGSLGRPALELTGPAQSSDPRHHPPARADTPERGQRTS